MNPFRLLKRLFRNQNKQRYDYHTLFHRVGRRLGIARAQVRFLTGQVDGLYERIDGQTERILERGREIRMLRQENTELRAKIDALTAIDPQQEVTRPGLVKAQ